MTFRIFLPLAAFLYTLSSFASWDLNDVSYLMPLPDHVSDNQLLKMNSEGKGGPLLRSSFLKEMPALTMHMTEEEMREALHVVAVRIDPCFPLPVPSACQRQVRLVWQPLELDRKGKVRTVDAALHSFYWLTESEFTSLLEEISQWKIKYKVQTQGEALQVHPAWSFQKDRSPALVDFQSIIRKYAGPDNFMRVTIMVLRGAGNMWAFGTFAPQEDGKLKPQPIARLSGKLTQTFINLAVPADHFEGGGIFPKPQGEDTINTLFEALSRVPPVAEDVIMNEFKALFRIENPKHFSPENMDCVSCHVTQPAKHFFYKNKPELKLDQMWSSSQYQNSKYNMKNLSSNLNDTQIIRAFGYFGDQMAISQRVINESAEVADWLNQNFHQNEN